MALVRNLGRAAYAPTLELQLQLTTKYRDITHGAVGEILLVEHVPPVYTFGLRQKDYAVHAERLRKLGAEVHKVGVREYVHRLEEAVIATCADFGVLAHTTKFTGVWVGGQQKICALGIQVSHGVSFHGLALNCCPDLEWFDHIVPCGISDIEVTSLSHQLNTTISPDDVAPSLVKNLAQTLCISFH